jgi:NTE family protein
MSAYHTLIGGASGFFTPRFPAPWLHLSGTTEATSAYDANCLKATLEQLIDFRSYQHEPHAFERRRGQCEER